MLDWSGWFEWTQISHSPFLDLNGIWSFVVKLCKRLSWLHSPAMTNDNGSFTSWCMMKYSQKYVYYSHAQLANFFKQMVEYYCADPVTIKWRKDFNTRIPASPLKFKVDDRSNFWELLNGQHSATSQKTGILIHTTLRILNLECKNIQNCKFVISAWRYN